MRNIWKWITALFVKPKPQPPADTLKKIVDISNTVSRQKWKEPIGASQYTNQSQPVAPTPPPSRVIREGKKPESHEEFQARWDQTILDDIQRGVEAEQVRKILEESTDPYPSQHHSPPSTDHHYSSSSHHHHSVEHSNHTVSDSTHHSPGHDVTDHFSSDTTDHTTWDD